MSAETVTPAVQPVPPKRSGVEGIKENSRNLRGTIALELVKDTDHFNDQDKQLIKFHGSYQQENRDARKSRRKEGVGKYYMFMVRCKIPGGRLTAPQYLAMDQLAEEHANGTLRLTTRQGIQLHGILKSDLQATIAGINQCLLSTLGACGDVERNVMACPAPHDHDGVHAELQETAAIIAAHLAPRTRGYHEIWLNGEPIADKSAEAEIEPIYGKVYLPRKFKTGLALPEDNCIDVYAQDLGLLAIVENGKIAGYNVLVGGGMGKTHGNENTFPHLARPICYVPAKAVVNAAEAVIKLFRDHGNRADRKRARIKYVVHDWGVERFREVLSEYVGSPLHLPLPVDATGFETHLGWHPQGKGKWYYGLSIENGRVKDEGQFRLRTALRTLVERLQPSLRITALQDILLCDLESGALPEIERALAQHGVLKPEQLSTVQKFSMSCPAIPTCGLAISESERALPKVIDVLEVELKRLGLEEEKLSVRMTGCPNGCARPYQSDIGIVGRSGDKYQVYVGGNVVGSRLNFPLRDLVPLAEIVPTLLPVLADFKQSRRPEEGFGDYCQRLGLEQLQKLLPSLPARDSKNRLEETVLSQCDGEVPVPALNGHAHTERLATKRSPALVPPETNPVALDLPAPAVASAPLPAAVPRKRSETVLAGPAGEELPDYTYRYHSDGSVRETVIYFYGEDKRAAAANPGDLLHREAIYRGQVDPYRLHSAHKLSDTHFVAVSWESLRDRRIEYHPDGRVSQSVVFHYDGDVRAKDAPSGAALRRQVSYEGTLSGE